MISGVQSLSMGQKPIIWQDFCRKLHENERNWTKKGRASLASSRQWELPNVQRRIKQNLVLFSDVGHHPKDNKHGIVFEEVRPLVKEILNYYNVNKSLCSDKTSQTVVTVVQAS